MRSAHVLRRALSSVPREQLAQVFKARLCFGGSSPADGTLLGVLVSRTAEDTLYRCCDYRTEAQETWGFHFIPRALVLDLRKH